MTATSDVPSRPFLVLCALGAGACVIGLDLFASIGALDEVAGDLAIPPQKASWMISLYTLCYAICAPINAALLRRCSRGFLFGLSMVLIGVGNLVCSAGDGLEPILAGRLVSALGAAMYLPAASTAAKDALPAERRGTALSFIYGGVTIAQGVGMPLTTWIAQTAGWRHAFVSVGALAFAAIVPLLLAAPQVRTTITGGSAVPDWRTPLSIPIGGLLATSFLVTVFDYVVYSYVSVLYSDTRLAGLPALAPILLAFGVGGILGNIATGVLTDRVGPAAVLLSVVAVQTVLLVTAVLARDNGEASAALAFLWGATSYMYLVPIQHRLLSRTAVAQSFVLALNSSIVNAGMAAGTAIGGVTLGLAGKGALAIVAGGGSLVALAIASLVMRRPRSWRAAAPIGGC